MKFSWKWLNDIVDLKHISLNELTNKLTLAGFEIEEIIKKEKIEDTIIDINITANRADVNSMVGLAREICSIFNISFHNDIYKKDNENTSIYPGIYNLENHDLLSECMLDIKFNTITQLKQITSPLWLKDYLNGCDIQCDHILKDLIQYINLKWGQDIEIFDLDKITKYIHRDLLLEFDKIDTNLCFHDLSTLQNINTRKIVNIIKYNNKILSVIGLESNNNLFCDENTSSILIIGKIYNPAHLIQITTATGIKTDVSNKHIKGISRDDLAFAYEEIIKLITNLNNGKVGKLCKYSTVKYSNNIIDISKSNINHILGPYNAHKNQYIDKNKIIEILQQLHFKPLYNQNKFSVTIPEHRGQDIIRSIDVIEEIARIHGFDKFLDELPLSNKIGNISENITIVKKIRQILRNAGLHEVMHYSLENQYKFSEKDNKDTILLYNPLLEDQSQLRNSLIKNLIYASKYNYKQTNLAFECFEIGKTFKQNIDKKIENLTVAGIMGNPHFSKYIWSEKNKSMNWFQAKGFLEDFFERLSANITWCTPDNLNTNTINQDWTEMLHPYRTAIILNQYNTSEIVGIFGQINTKLKNELNLNYELYIFEINILNLIKSRNKKEHLHYNFTGYSNYPSVTRDISLILKKTQSINFITEYILSRNNPLIESVEMFNEYKDPNQNINQRNVSFRITYRSNIRTLNDQDIKNIDSEISNLLKTFS